MALLLFAATCGFAFAALGWLLFPGPIRSHALALQAPFIVAGAVLAATAATHATGWWVADLAWRVVMAAGAATLGATATPLALVAVTAVLALAAGGAWAPVAAGAAGTQAACAAMGGRSRPLGAFAGAAAASAALHLERPGGAAMAAIGALAIASLGAAGVAGLSRRRRRHVLRRARVALVAGIVLVVVGAISAITARSGLEEGVRLSDEALASAWSGDAAAGGAMLRDASGAFASGHRALDEWWARPARILPILGVNLEVAASMARSGAELSAVGASALGSADIDQIRLSNGTVPLDKLVALRRPARRSMDALKATETALAGLHRPLLAPPLSRRLDRLRARVTDARGDAQTAVQATDVLPAMLGADGPRRYFLAVVTPSELRGSGGIVGNFGEITAEAGKLTLTRLGRSRDLSEGGDPTRTLSGPPEYLGRYAIFFPQTFWQNVTLSPDFPTVAKVIGELYPKSGGQPVDGVISVDPITLARLLRIVGPVEVPGLPGPLTAANAERELLYEQYVRFPNSDRIDFLGEAAQRIWDRFTSSDLPGPRKLASVMGPAVTGRHLQIASLHPTEQALLDRLKLSGRVAPVDGDFLGVVTQNLNGNKIDWFLDRTYSYDVRVDPATGALEADLRLKLRNRAPASGLPPIVIGPYPDIDTIAGQNRLLLSIYTPWSLDGATVGGEPLLLQSELELGRRVYAAFIDIPSGTTADITVRLSGTYATGSDYRLDMLRQPVVRPDDVDVSVRAGKVRSSP